MMVTPGSRKLKMAMKIMKSVGIYLVVSFGSVEFGCVEVGDAR